LHGGKLLLKALCQANASTDVERLAQNAPWRGEADCLLAMQTGIDSPVGPPRTSVQRPGDEWLAVGLARLFIDLSGDNRVAGFARRLGIWGAAVAVFLGLLALTSAGAGLLTLVCLVPALVAILGLGFTLFSKAAEILILHRWGQALIRELYSQRLTYPPVDLVTEGVASDPVTAKYSRELEESGAVHYFDSRSAAKTQTTYLRCYLLPGVQTYLILKIVLRFRAHHSYPAKVLFTAYTFFSDGHTLVVGNSELRVRLPADPRVTTRMHPDVNALPEFLVRHGGELRQLLDAGKQPAPRFSPQEVMTKVADLHEKTGEQLARYGYYSWPEAIVQSFVIGQHDEL
jgi:hypothetical protein